MDKIIKQWKAERPGNDTWLRFRLTLGYDWDDVVLELSENHDGWAGNIRQTRKIVFNYDEEITEERVLEYVREFCENDSEIDEIYSEIKQLLADKDIKLLPILKQEE